MAALLNIDDLKNALPVGSRKALTQDIVDTVNSISTDQTFREMYRDNLISYASVLKEGKFKLVDYLSAVRYVSYKLMGCTNKESYIKAFPDKYQRLVDDEKSDKDISAYIAMYNKNKLVALVYEQTIIPSHVLNQDLYQRAINHQAFLMLNAKSEKVQSDAAKSLMDTLKPPEVKKVELDIGVKEDSSIDALRQSTMELVAEQRRAIQAGAINAQEAAHSKLALVDVEGEVVSTQ